MYDSVSEKKVGNMDSAVVHVWGLPWQYNADTVAAVLAPMLPAQCRLLEAPILPLDKKARNTGRALLRLDCSAVSVDEVVKQLNKQAVPLPSSSDGTCCSASSSSSSGDKRTRTESGASTRYLEARPSSVAELESQRRAIDKVAARAELRAPQSFSQPTAEHAFSMPSDMRDVVVLCHETRAEVSTGGIDLNNLIQGRVDMLARCVSSALFVSHGVRALVRVWLLMQDAGVSLCIDGSTVKGLHPDERTIAAAMRKALRATGDEGWPKGWTVHRGETLSCRLASLLAAQKRDGSSTLQEPHMRPGREQEQQQTEDDDAGRIARRLLILHELGEPLTPPLLRTAGQEDARRTAGAPGTILVVGGHQGFSVADERNFDELGGLRVSVSPVPLLASHCIVLAHAVLDAVSLSCERHG